MNPREKKSRLVACLALYLLFAFIPGLHAALHPITGSATPPGESPVAELTAACPDGCENPQHHHLRGTHNCPVCRTGWSPAALPQPGQEGLHVEYSGPSLARGSSSRLRAPDIRIKQARAPPERSAPSV